LRHLQVPRGKRTYDLGDDYIDDALTQDEAARDWC
jgi:hypothetical protein